MSTSGKGGILRLAAAPNSYDWGPIGIDSFITSLTPQACPPDFKVDPKKPYSELWMGTHPTGPARLYDTGELLSEHLTEHPEQLGDAEKRFDAPFDEKTRKEVGEGHVPFLFKILCCKQALPLQIHPNTELASRLHQENPEQFPDTNHKPEIAVCLSERFLGFASFRPIAQIKALLQSTPETRQLSAKVQDAVRPVVDLRTESGDEEHGKLVKEAWRAFLESNGQEAKQAVVAFTQRVAKEGAAAFDTTEIPSKEKENLAEAVKILDEYNNGDVAIFASILFMNLIELHTGEGIYVGADGPHAWLQGDIVELMAISDNVLNVGFTDDKDSIALTAQTVSGASKTADSLKLKHSKWKKSKNGKVEVYMTPFEEFSILHCSGNDTLGSISGPGIAIITRGSLQLSAGDGESMKAEKGSVFFVPARTEVDVEGDGDLWMAFYDGDEAVAGQVGAQ